MSEQEFHVIPDPKVGMGATLIYPQDRYPYVITKVSKSGKTITVEALHTVSKATGHEASRHDGPWPIWDHTYSPEELVQFAYSDAEKRTYEEARTHLGDSSFGFTLRLTDNGWRRGGKRGTPFIIGKARYYRNYSY